MSNNITKKSFAWNTIMQFSFIGFQFLSTIVLTRFLEPSDYGIIGIINIFILLGNLFVDSGLSGALIYKKNVKDIDYSTMFIFNLSISIFIYIFLFFFAKPIAIFYGIPNLILIIRVSTIVIIIHAFQTIPVTYLTKKLDFKHYTIINLVSSAVTFVSTVILAVLGLGVWTLVLQLLIHAFTLVILLNLYVKYFPPLKFSFESFKVQFKFGFNCLVGSIFRLVGDNILTNYIAKINSQTSTGYYVQATRFHTPCISFINSVLDRTLFPIISKIDDKSIQSTKINFFTRVMFSFAITITPLLLIISPSTITLLLGEKWHTVGDYFNVLVLSIPAFALQTSIRNALKSIGNTTQILYNDILRFVLIIFLIIFTYKLDIISIMKFYVLVQYFLSLILFLILLKFVSFRICIFLKEIFINLFSSLTPYYFIIYIINTNDFIICLILSLSYIIITLLLHILFKSEIYLLIKKTYKYD